MPWRAKAKRGKDAESANMQAYWRDRGRRIAPACSRQGGRGLFGTGPWGEGRATAGPAGAWRRAERQERPGRHAVGEMLGRGVEPGEAAGRRLLMQLS